MYNWNIEVSFYELKMFWGLKDYRLLSATGIERLVNLQGLAYGFTSMLPYLDPVFNPLAKHSIQERRFLVGKKIQEEAFLSNLGRELEINEKYPECYNARKAPCTSGYRILKVLALSNFLGRAL